MNTLAIVLATDEGANLSFLSSKRSKSAVPFAGKYRLIDFALSNCVNSGIFDVGVVTQYWIRSLDDYIRSGRPWGLDRQLSGGITLLPPYQQTDGSHTWYRGMSNALFQNLEFVLARRPDTVLIIPGDQIYKMDFRPLLSYHHDHQAGLTICAARRPLSSGFLRESLVTDEEGRVVELRGEPLGSSSILASMGIYVFRTDLLVQCLSHAARPYSNWNQDFSAELVAPMLKLDTGVYAYAFDGYWADVDTVQAYWKASMDLLRPNAPLDLSDRRWEIHTRNEERPPAIIHSGAVVSNSLITDGCIVDGKVENSVLFPGVRVDAGAFVRYSVVFDDCEIGSGAVVNRAILDKDVVVGQNARIGLHRNGAPQCYQGTGFAKAITIVEEGTRLPADCCAASAPP